MDFFDTVVTEDAKAIVRKCLDSGMLSEGKIVASFEDALEQVFGYKGVAVNSGTSALHLALILACVNRGDEVILPAQTFVATGLAVLYCGAIPVFADIQMNGNIDTIDVRRKITKKTKAIICVSWGGNPCDLLTLQVICRDYGLKLIQDNAQAFGATYLGNPISDYGDFSCFSFQAIKHLTTGDGGLLVCKSEEDYEKARRLRWFGIDRNLNLADETGERQYNLSELGYKYHMNDYSAALGLGNLHGVKGRLLARKRISEYYDTYLQRYWISRNVGSSHWLYTIWVEKRDGFIKMMKSKNISVSVVHVGIDRNNIFRSVADLPVQRKWDEHHICLPCHSSLSVEDCQRIVEAVKGGW